jgi:hypothetical protein
MLLQVSKETEITGTHTANLMYDWLRHYGWEVMDQPPYSHNVMLRDFHLFGPLKKHLDSNGFAANIYMKQAVTSWLQTLDPDFFHAGIQALVPWLDKC